MLTQGTPAWHAWRLEGIGASEASAVLGLPSAWLSRYALWQIKTRRTKEAPANFAMRRGTQLEPHARREYERRTGIAMPPTLAVHTEHPHLRASLDGWNAKENRVLEIKVAGREDHELARRFKMPPKHVPQTQQQLLVTGAESLDYFSFDGHTGYIVRIEPDFVFQRLLVEQINEFWHLVLTDTPPEFKAPFKWTA